MVSRKASTAVVAVVLGLATALAGAPAANASSTSAWARPDRCPPTAPAKLYATGATSASIILAWNASSDNVGVVAYRVYRQGALIGSVNALTFADTGLTAGTSYSYTVTAVDAAGNVSAPSNTLTVSTLSAGDIVADHVGCEYRYDFDNSWYIIRITLYVTYTGSYSSGGPFDGWVTLDGNLISGTLGSSTFSVTVNGPGPNDLSGVFVVDSQNQLGETDETNNSVSYNGDPSMVGGDPVDFTSYPC